MTACAPDGGAEQAAEDAISEQRLMQRMNWALDRLVEDPKRVVLHLEARSAEADPPAPAGVQP